MKVYYWTPYMEKVGTIKATINSAIALKKRGYDVKIYKTYREWEGYEDILAQNDIEIIDFGLSRKFHNLSTEGVGYRISMIIISIFSFKKLIKSYENDRPDVVIANLLGYLPLLAREKSAYKPKLVSSIQGKPKIHAVRKVLWKWLYAKTDKIITLSESTRAEMLEKLGFPEEKFTLLPNPIIDDSMDVLSNETMEEAFYHSEKKVILGVGRLTRQKDFKTLIRAFAKVREKLDCTLAILGEGEEEKEVKDLCRELGVEEDVYLPGFVKNPYKYMRHSDLFVLSSLWEDAGHVLVEAAYLKIPIVSTRCPHGQEEFLEFGKAGELCAISDVDEMAEKMLAVLTDNKNEARMEKVERAYQNSLVFHINTHGEKLDAILKELVEVK